MNRPTSKHTTTEMQTPIKPAKRPSKQATNSQAKRPKLKQPLAACVMGSFVANNSSSDLQFASLSVFAWLCVFHLLDCFLCVRFCCSRLPGWLPVRSCWFCVCSRMTKGRPAWLETNNKNWELAPCLPMEAYCQNCLFGWLFLCKLGLEQGEYNCMIHHLILAPFVLVPQSSCLSGCHSSKEVAAPG